MGTRCIQWLVSCVFLLLPLRELFQATDGEAEARGGEGSLSPASSPPSLRKGLRLFPFQRELCPDPSVRGCASSLDTSGGRKGLPPGEGRDFRLQVTGA